jgi:hypothetical protein
MFLKTLTDKLLYSLMNEDRRTNEVFTMTNSIRIDQDRDRYSLIDSNRINFLFAIKILRFPRSQNENSLFFQTVTTKKHQIKNIT